MLEVGNEKIPLTADGEGVLRVTGTRVRLDTIVTAFELGDTPEQIVQSYDSLRLDDVYAVITYYLRHQDDVQSYLMNRQEKRDEVRKLVQATFPTNELRERLLRRRQEQKGA
jgi:uncharacterized protein (DUF433 family)